MKIIGLRVNFTTIVAAPPSTNRDENLIISPNYVPKVDRRNDFDF
jgi:hypothetical protein